MSKPKVPGGKTKQSRHLKSYVREVDRGTKSRPLVDRIIAGAIFQLESRPTIHYILGGSFDDRYQSKCQQKKLLRVATVKTRANVVHTGGSHEEAKPIDGPISFPLVNPNRVIVPSL